jgi:predicted N-acetyltransferase YhbS
MIIRPITALDDLQELTQLLNRAYKKLSDQGFRFLASHQDAATTKQRLERYRGFVAIMNDKIIATICYHPPGTTKGHLYYEREGAASFGQFAVEPALQRSGIGGRLIAFVENEAIKDGAAEMVLDTAEGANELLDFYTKRGYRAVDTAQWDVTNYRSIVLSKDLRIAR